MPSIKFECDHFDRGVTNKLKNNANALNDWDHDAHLDNEGKLILYFYNLTIEQVSQVRSVVRSLGIKNPKEDIFLQTKDLLSNTMNLLLKNDPERYTLEWMVTLLNEQVKNGAKKFDLFCHLKILFQACHWIGFNAERIDYDKYYERNEYEKNKPERALILRLIRDLAIDDNSDSYDVNYIRSKVIILLEDIKRIRLALVGKKLSSANLLI